MAAVRGRDYSLILARLAHSCNIGAARVEHTDWIGPVTGTYDPSLMFENNWFKSLEFVKESETKNIR